MTGGCGRQLESLRLRILKLFHLLGRIISIQKLLCPFPWEKHQQMNAYVFLAFSSVQSLSRVLIFATPWITARQASLSIISSRSWLKLMPIESVMPSSHLILCRPLLLLPPVPPSIRVFSNESTVHMRWPLVLLRRLPWGLLLSFSSRFMWFYFSQTRDSQTF